MTAIRAGRLFDSKAGRMLTDQTVLLNGERITEVGARAQVKIPADARVIDLSDATVLPGLIDALKDGDVNVRHAAAASLGQIGAAAAVLPLVHVLQDEPWLQYPAIHALGELGDARAAPALAPALAAPSNPGTPPARSRPCRSRSVRPTTRCPS